MLVTFAVLFGICRKGIAGACKARDATYCIQVVAFEETHDDEVPFIILFNCVQFNLPEQTKSAAFRGHQCALQYAPCKPCGVLARGSHHARNYVLKVTADHNKTGTKANCTKFCSRAAARSCMHAAHVTQQEVPEISKAPSAHYLCMLKYLPHEHMNVRICRRCLSSFCTMDIPFTYFSPPRVTITLSPGSVLPPFDAGDPPVPEAPPAVFPATFDVPLFPEVFCAAPSK